MLLNFKSSSTFEEELQGNDIRSWCDNTPKILPQNQINHSSNINAQKYTETSEDLHVNQSKTSFNIMTQNCTQNSATSENVLYKNNHPSKSSEAITSKEQAKNLSIVKLKNLLQDGFKVLKSTLANTSDLIQSINAVQNSKEEESQQNYNKTWLNSEQNFTNPKLCSSITHCPKIQNTQTKDLMVVNEVEVSHVEKTIADYESIPASGENEENSCSTNDSKLQERIIEDLLDFEQSEKMHDMNTLSTQQQNKWKIKKNDIDNLKMKVIRVKDLNCNSEITIESIKAELVGSDDSMESSSLDQFSDQKTNEQQVMGNLSAEQNNISTSMIEFKNIEDLQKRIEKVLEEIEYRKENGFKTKPKSQQGTSNSNLLLPKSTKQIASAVTTFSILPQTAVSNPIKRNKRKCLPRKLLPNILQRRTAGPAIIGGEGSLGPKMPASTSTSNNNSGLASSDQPPASVPPRSMLPKFGVKKKRSAVRTSLKRSPPCKDVETSSSHPEVVKVASRPEGGWNMFPVEVCRPRSPPMSGVKKPLPVVWQGFINVLGTTRIFLHAVEVNECSCKMSREIPSLLTMITNKPAQQVFNYLAWRKLGNNVIPVVYFPPPEDPVGIHRYKTLHTLLESHQWCGIVRCPFSGAGMSPGENAFVDMYLVPASSENLPPANLLPPAAQKLVSFGSAALLGFMVRPRVKRTAEMAGLPPGDQPKQPPPFLREDLTTNQLVVKKEMIKEEG